MPASIMSPTQPCKAPDTSKLVCMIRLHLMPVIQGIKQSKATSALMTLILSRLENESGTCCGHGLQPDRVLTASLHLANLCTTRA